MNTDSSHDPLDFDNFAPDHSLDAGHYAASAAPLDFHHAADLGGQAFHHNPMFGPLDHGINLGAAHPHVAGSHVIGEPNSAGVWHQQQTSFTCAVVSQEMILREFGVNVNEASLMGDAMQHGWLSSTGTQFQDVGKLLELHGVPCHNGQGFSDMMSDLAQGHKVIVGVDSTDLWHGDSWIARELHDMTSGGPQADHAIVVQGLRQDDSGNWHVIVNDPGNPNGAGHDYPLDQFADAWQGSHCQFTSTDIAPQGLASHPVYGNGYDEHSGTYPGVMDWLHSHTNVIRGSAMGAALAVRSVVSCKLEKSEKERNDILRGI